ncbi:unnamed protein product [Vitrella brassicaformis CCMP3155]|uniref:Uncharacterized protein n=2 Tax=Vitrella brassicaformis TaxID=1169539 RepID=A0A0G4G0Z8_VITBC|nr:unnamed protein product [Vitrella brassicaformis CCMP3155]|eukprot:CEM21651.1 unnamed protein product [Vitrella brassicaformis CCMP3155]
MSRLDGGKWRTLEGLVGKLSRSLSQLEVPLQKESGGRMEDDEASVFQADMQKIETLKQQTLDSLQDVLSRLQSRLDGVPSLSTPPREDTGSCQGDGAPARGDDRPQTQTQMPVHVQGGGGAKKVCYTADEDSRGVREQSPRDGERVAALQRMVKELTHVVAAKDAHIDELLRQQSPGHHAVADAFPSPSSSPSPSPQIIYMNLPSRRRRRGRHSAVADRRPRDTSDSWDKDGSSNSGDSSSDGGFPRSMMGKSHAAVQCKGKEPPAGQKVFAYHMSGLTSPPVTPLWDTTTADKLNKIIREVPPPAPPTWSTQTTAVPSLCATQSTTTHSDAIDQLPPPPQHPYLLPHHIELRLTPDGHGRFLLTPAPAAAAAATTTVRVEGIARVDTPPPPPSAPQAPASSPGSRVLHLPPPQRRECAIDALIAERERDIQREREREAMARAMRVRPAGRPVGEGCRFGGRCGCHLPVQQ